MSETQRTRAAKKPPIHLSEFDYDRIADLALRMENSNPTLSKLVLDEINRAKVYPDAKLPANVVALGSEVEFLDDSNDTRRRVTLVIPQDADIANGRVSIMTPVGAGLIGMSEGQEINWPCPDGRARTLRILSVTQRP